MFSSFRIRLLIAIVATTILALVMQTSGGRSFLDPALQYAMRTDYSTLIAETVSPWVSLPRGGSNINSIPAAAQNLIQKPCEIIAIEKEFGWYWSDSKGKQVLFPGVYLALASGSEVRSILPGKVDLIVSGKGPTQVKIIHTDSMISLYAGLTEVEVVPGQELIGGERIGSSGDHLYFELRSQNQPVDPLNIFQ